MTVIYRNSPIPLYHQLKEIMRTQIRSGEWQPGALVPSERELSETYGLSRMTARQAITELVNEGALYREQGKGTFVSTRRIPQQLMRLTGFTEDMRTRSRQPSTQVLSAGLSPADEVTAEHLRVAPGHSVFRLLRLRLADGQPLALESSHLNFKGCEALAQEDLEHNSLYPVLAARFSIPLLDADQEMEAGLAGEDEARHLHVAVGSPVLFTRRTTYTDRNQPVEYAQSVYRGNEYTLFVHLKREQLT